MTLPEFSVRQMVLVNVLFVVCLVGGWNALQLTEVEYFHDVTLNQVVVITRWDGASAEEVERLVTTKIEKELLAVSGVDEIRSSSQSNLSSISIDIDETLGQTEYESAVNSIRGALDRVRDLPSDAEEPTLREIITADVSPVIFIAISDVGGTGDVGNVGELAIRDVAQEIQSRVRDLPGVSTVEIRGLQDREVRVLVDRKRARLYDLTVSDIADRVRRQNQNLPAGTFQDTAGEATLRAVGDYSTVEEILDTIVSEDGARSRIRLRDVARVERGLEKPIYLTRYNGRPASIVSVGKKDKTDVRELTKRVHLFLDDFKELVPAGIQVRTTLDSSDFVTPRIAVLLNNLATGMLFVMALLWFTIGFRNSLLTIIAIPFSFLTAILFFPILDISINSNTLVGMLLVSGMLVDDAIIVLENIYRRIEEGEELRSAVINGANEVLWPVVTAVFTTIAAFAPLLLIGGTAGKFISVLPKCVVVCLIASLFECLVILPAHYLEFGSRTGTQARHTGSSPWHRLARFFEGLRTGMDRGFDKLRSVYTRALIPILTHRPAFIILFVALLFATFAGSQHLRFELFPGEFSTLNVNLETPPGHSLERTSAMTQRIEERIQQMPKEDVRDFNTVVGMSIDLNYDRILAPNLAMTTIAIPQTERNQLAPEKVLQRVKADLEELASLYPDDVVSLRIESQRNGPPVGRPVEVRIQSEDFATNKTIADELKVYLATIPGVFGIDDNLKEGPRELQLRIDDERAGPYGLTFEDLANALRAANDGIVSSSFRSPSAVEDDDIRVLLEPGQRDRILDLLEVEVRSTTGRLIRLADVAKLEASNGYLAYRRVNGKRAVTVFADVDDDLATSVSVGRNLEARFADVRARFPQVDLIYGGEYQETNEAMANMLAAFPVALLLIYMMLATLFKSYLQPFIVLTSIPLGFAGIVFGVGALDYKISFSLLYASVGLAGVVVNDALVLVDFINRARRDGMPMLEAVAQAGTRRLRPVILTTMTTVAALLPMAFGLLGSSKSYGPFAAAIAFGLLFAMFGTLFVIPLSYATLTKLEERGQHLLTRLRKTRGSGSDESERGVPI